MHLHQEIQLQHFLTLEKFPQQKFPHQIAGEIFITFKSGKRKSSFVATSHIVLLVIVSMSMYLVLIISHHGCFASMAHSICWTCLKLFPQWSTVQMITKLHK